MPNASDSFGLLPLCALLASCAISSASLETQTTDAQVQNVAAMDAGQSPGTVSDPAQEAGAGSPQSAVDAAMASADAGASDSTRDAAMPMGATLCDTQLSGVAEPMCTSCLGTSCCSQAQACEDNPACLTFWNCKQAGKSDCQPPADQALSVVALVQALTSCASSRCASACPTMVSM